MVKHILFIDKIIDNRKRYVYLTSTNMSAGELEDRSVLMISRQKATQVPVATFWTFADVDGNR